MMEKRNKQTVENFIEFDEKLYKDWLAAYPKPTQLDFCYDGLCWYRSKNSNQHEEVLHWLKADKKILFLMKETNGNPNCDMREWGYYDDYNENGCWTRVNKFFIVIIKWLWALNTISKNNTITFDKTREEYIRLAELYPLAIVNAKKTAGGASVESYIIQEAAARDAELLSKQIKELFSPNIIVCGGAGMLNIAKEIYKGEIFIKVNNNCHYSKDRDILLIDAYHPSSRVSNKKKFDDLILSYQDFLQRKDLL